jgi:hypothetical protein
MSDDLDRRFDESCKAIGEGIARLHRANATLIEALEECRDYFDERADADGDVTGFTGNEEMKLLVLVDAALVKGRRA